MLVIYKGLSGERKKALASAMNSAMRYPERRNNNGANLNLSNDDADSPARVKFVNDQRAAFKASYQAQVKEAAEKIDAERTVGGVTYKKGVAVEIAELTPKLKALVEAGEFEVGKAKG